MPGVNDTAVFDASSTSNLSTTLGADQAVFGLKITVPTAGVIISGVNTLTLGAGGIDMSTASQNLAVAALVAMTADQTWNVASGRVLNMQTTAVLSGTNVNLTKIGAGTLSLRAANTYTGTTTVGGGTLSVFGSLNGTTGTDLTFTGSGTFNVNEASGVSQGMKVLRFSAGDGAVKSTRAGGTITLRFSSRAARTTGATGNFQYTGGTFGTAGATNNIAITGELTGQLMDTGLFYNGTSYAAYDAGGFVRALIYGGTDLNAPAVIATGATLGVDDPAQNVKVTGSITAQTTASVNTINLGASNFTMFDGNQVFSTNGILSAGGTALSINSGKLQPTTSGSEMIIRVDGASDVLTITSILQNNGATPALITKSGLGTLTLGTASIPAVNTYGGGTFVNAGTLTVVGNGGGAGRASAVLGTGRVTLADSVTLKVQDTTGQEIRFDIPFTLVGGYVNLPIVFGGGTDVRFNNTVSGAGGFKITNDGNGRRLELPNANTFSGGITLSGSQGEMRIRIGNANALGTGTLRSELTSSGSGGLENTADLSAASGVPNAIEVIAGSLLNVGNNSTQPMLLSGVISGAGTFNKLGSGTVTLSGANIFTGQLAVLGGALNVATVNDTGVAGPLMKSTLPIILGKTGGVLGTFEYSGTTASSNRAFSIAAGGTGAFQIDNAAASLTLGGIISGTGALSKTGPGTLILSSTGNTYSGTPTISAGILQLGTGVTGQNGAMASASYVNNATIVINNGDAQTFSSTISGTGSLVKIGNAPLTLSGLNTFSGGTTLAAGTLNISNAQALGTGPISFSAASTFDNTSGLDLTMENNPVSFTGTGPYTVTFAGSRPLNMGTGIVTFSATGTKEVTLSIAASSLSIGGGITGAADQTLIKTGPGNLILEGNNSIFPGTLVLNQGTLNINSALSTNTTANSGEIRVSGALSGTTTINAATVVVSGTLSGATTVNDGGRIEGDNGTLGNVTVNSGGTFAPGGGGIGALTVSGNLALNPSSIFNVQFNSDAFAVDAISLDGNLNITSGAVLNVSDLGTNPGQLYGVAAHIITYGGAWNGGTFLGLPDDSYFASGDRNYFISYNDPNPDGPGTLLTLTMVQSIPEPCTAVSLLAGLGLLLGAHRQRRQL